VNRAVIRHYAISRGMRYRITRAGHVDMFGSLPGSHLRGWYRFAGSEAAAVSRIVLETWKPSDGIVGGDV
jgi:hypothetical protein